MGATGLFLCFFLVVHLIGNLLLYVGEGTYNEYAHKLHDNPEFLILAEVLLYTAFAVHIAYAFRLLFLNRAARNDGYAMQQSKRKDRVLSPVVPTADKTMFVTGLVVLFFLAVHLSDFKLEIGWRETLAGAEPFAKARLIVSNMVRGLIYLVGSLVLGIHVSHGLQSSLQSLGLNHPKYTPSVRYASWLFGVIVAIGFGSFPVVAWIGSWGTP